MTTSTPPENPQNLLATPPSDTPPENPQTSIVDIYSQVHLKRENDKLILIFPKIISEWAEIIHGLKNCLQRTEKTWNSYTPIHLMVDERLLDARQLQTLAEILQAEELQIARVYTSRRQTAVAAATAGYSVEQQAIAHAFLTENKSPLPQQIEPLYIKTTVRSGMEICHPGTVVIQGDVNPGGLIVADGDILIWGTLRGIAHAGAKGNQEATIMALRMEPTQLRIADTVARPPAKSLEVPQPEIAHLTSEGIRLSVAYNFSKIKTAIKVEKQDNK